MKNLTNTIKNYLVPGILAFSTLSGCASYPSPGQGRPKHLVGFPRHPAMMLFQAGEYNFEKREDQGERQILITKHHWIAGKEGNVTLSLPKGATNEGYAVTQGLFNNNVWVGYDLDGNRYVENHRVGMGARKSKLVERINVVWDERRNKYIRKEE